MLSLSAVGSLRADLPPGTFVVVDQFIDRTFAARRQLLRHRPGGPCVDGAPGVPAPGPTTCWRRWPRRACRTPRGGTYLAMEGPQFSTLAESQLYRSWNASVIGMTNMPEAKLAREAELCYCSVGMVTDFDCWHPAHDAVTVDAVIQVLLGNAQTARTLVAGWPAPSPSTPRPLACACRHALDHALITSPEARDPAMVEQAARGIAGACCEGRRTWPLRPRARRCPTRDAVQVIDQRLLPHRLHLER